VGHPGEAEWKMFARTPDIGAAITSSMDEVGPVLPRFGGQFERFHDAILGGGELPVTLDDARRSLELISAIFHAEETATSVTLPIGPDHPKYRGWVPRTSAA
jgi:predicted dehydrogenase